jgi:hypothetical protein
MSACVSAQKDFTTVGGGLKGMPVLLDVSAAG